MSKFCCLTCNYFTTTNGHLKQHKLTKKHLNVVNNVEAPICPFKCSKCERGYQSKSGLRKHKLLCTVVVDAIEAVVVPTVPEVVNIDLHAKIDNVERMIIEMAKNQQTPINNEITNNNNITNYINVFLNDKCQNDRIPLRFYIRF